MLCIYDNFTGDRSIHVGTYFKKHQNLLTNASIFPCLSMAFLIVDNHTHKRKFCMVVVNFQMKITSMNINDCLISYFRIANSFSVLGKTSLFYKSEQRNQISKKKVIFNHTSTRSFNYINI